MNNRSWEQQAVDEILEKEQRIDEMYNQLEKLENLWHVASAIGLNTANIEEKIETIQEGLDAILKEVE